MSVSPVNRSTTFLLVASFFMAASPIVAGEKLKVFILAGQSNTVGHARAHTIATLYKAGKPAGENLTRLVFKDNTTIPKAMDEQLVRARQIDELSGGIGLPKIKNMPDGTEKKALQAQVDQLLEAHEA